MADMIQCPVCGAENPPSQKICQRCQTPLTSDSSFQPGQSPVHKDTGELEAILPEWLRDARESAKQTDSPAEQASVTENEPPAKPAASSMDFLAGLQSQSADNDEEEVPDWLASITGTSSPKQKEEQTDTSGIRWVETGKKDDFQQSETPEEVPAWLAGIQTPQFGEEEKDELTDWFRESGAQEQSFQPQESQAAADFEPQPDFSNPVSDDAPDWLKQMAAEAGEKQPEPQSDSSFDSADWFNQIPSDSNESAQPPASADTPDWLSQLQANENVPAQPAASEPFALSSNTPDWLNNLGAIPSGDSAAVEQPASAESEPFASGGDVPSWLAPEQDASQKTDSTPRWLQNEGENKADVPAWLTSDQEMFTPEEQPAEKLEDVLGDLPDWLKSAAPDTTIFDEPVKEVELPKTEMPQAPTSLPFESAPAFAESDLPAQNDALFTEMPDWLSNAMEAQPDSSDAMPEAMTGSDALASDALPSWVEAMRPSDQGMAGIVSAANDQTLEARGGLAGLAGVLPAGAGFAPTSKPKAYSIKLNASEEQMKHAAILEQILAAETAPESLASEKAILPSRGLRWTLAFLLLAVALVTSFLRTQIFSTPLGVPSELGYAVAVAQAIPENSPVLVAVDYEPSRAGEMEAAAAPLFDNLLLLKHPRLTFIASNESGAILAERFIAGPLAVHNYQSGVTYLNLGYLSGGQMGIRAFAQNPAVASPMNIYNQSAWDLPPLQGVTALDQFAVIILITDDPDAARSWVEQTQGSRGAAPLLVVSSAQAAPMIQPYYDSGQVNGMVSGLYGGAIFERQYNNGRPGTARTYWDAYSIGMLLAMMFVLGGGFVNLALGLRDRAAMREAN